MRLLISAFVLPFPAAAHTGHIGEVAGHDHWVAGAAIGLAAAIGLWQVVRGRRAKKRRAEEGADAETAR